MKKMSNTNMGYFIDQENTPVSKIDFNQIKSKGITEVYYRVFNKDYITHDETLSKIKAAGLKPFVWIWEGFSYTSYMASKGWNICMDMETYNMETYYNEIKKLRTDSQGKTFILCTKPQDWDGDQKWSVTKDYCDYLMPMVYLGDYNKSISQLNQYMEHYNTLYPGKIYPALETYISDANVVPKSNTVLNEEINTCKPYSEVGIVQIGVKQLMIFS
jgi:hypothetical protein